MLTLVQGVSLAQQTLSYDAISPLRELERTHRCLSGSRTHVFAICPGEHASFLQVPACRCPVVVHTRPLEQTGQIAAV